MYNKCMATVNISLPDKLKDQAQDLIANGFYSSLSDLIRDSLRTTIEKNKYDLLADEAGNDLINGTGILLKSEEEVDRYFDSI